MILDNDHDYQTNNNKSHSYDNGDNANNCENIGNNNDNFQVNSENNTNYAHIIVFHNPSNNDEDDYVKKTIIQKIKSLLRSTRDFKIHRIYIHREI